MVLVRQHLFRCRPQFAEKGVVAAEATARVELDLQAVGLALGRVPAVLAWVLESLAQALVALDWKNPMMNWTYSWSRFYIHRRFKAYACDARTLAKKRDTNNKGDTWGS